MGVLLKGRGPYITLSKVKMKIALKTAFLQLSTTSITYFGKSGPYPSYPSHLQLMIMI
jgi:hypothetical protein